MVKNLHYIRPVNECYRLVSSTIGPKSVFVCFPDALPRIWSKLWIVRGSIFMIVGVAVALAWMAIWASCLHLFGIAFSAVFMRRPEDRARRRERIKRMGKVWYTLVFGVLGFGVALGLAITIGELLDRESHGWIAVVEKFVLYSVLGGWFQGAWSWSENFRDPVPFPPNYLPPK